MSGEEDLSLLYDLLGYRGGMGEGGGRRREESSGGQ